MWNIYENVQSEDVEWVRHYYPHSIIQSDERYSTPFGFYSHFYVIIC